MKKNMVLAGLFAAMVTVSISLLPFKILSNNGYVHMGDTIIYLAAAMLPTPYAVAAAAVGGGLADVLVAAPMWAPFTVVIKAMMVLPFTAKKEKLLCRRNMLAPVFAGVIGIVGYYLAEIIILCLSGGDLAASAVTAVAAIPFNGLQELFGGVAFLLLAVALDRLQIKKRLARK